MAGFSHRPVTPADISIVLADLCTPHQGDVERSGFSVDEARDYLVAASSMGGGDAIQHGGEVLAVVVWAPDDGEARISFLACPGLFAHGGELALYSRRYMRELSRRLGVPTFSRTFASGMPVDRWLASMGVASQGLADGGRTVSLPVGADR